MVNSLAMVKFIVKENGTSGTCESWILSHEFETENSIKKKNKNLPLFEINRIIFLFLLKQQK
jgi:hypothetical protein